MTYGMKNGAPGVSASAGFAVLLTALFVGLRLMGQVGWSWWWVLCPLWIGFTVLLVVVLAAIAEKVGREVGDEV